MKKRAIYLLFAIITISLTHLASAQTWTGSGDGVSWNDPLNWTSLPSSGGAVILPSAPATGAPTATTQNIAGLNLGSLTLNSSSTNGWTINPGEDLNIVAGNTAATLFSAGAAQNIITNNVRFVVSASNSTLATTTSRISAAAGNTLRIDGNLTTGANSTIRFQGNGTVHVAGGLTGGAPGSSTTDAFVVDNATLLFSGSSLTRGGGGRNGFGFFGNSTLMWNSTLAPDTTNLGRIVLRDAIGDKMFVFNNNFSMATGTSNNQFAFVGGGSTGSLGFSIIGGSNRTVTMGTSMTWNTGEGGSNGIMRQATFKLNTHADSNAKLTYTTGLIINRNGTQRTIEVGNVSGVAIDAEISGVISAGGTGSSATTLRKTGSGVLLLSGANTYNDTLHVAAGTLLISSTNNFPEVIVDSGATFGGTGSASSAVVSGAGLVSPGNKPGILRVDSVNPTGGLDFAFELTQPGLPTWSSTTAPGNDVFRLDNTTAPFTASLSANNTISIYASSTGTFTGGFFTDRDSDFTSLINDATFVFYLHNPSGPFVFDGVNYAAASGSWSVTQISSADFASGTVKYGWSTQFTVIPEPGTALLFALGLGTLLLHRRTRQGRLS